MADGADGFSAIARQHDAVLNLVLLLLDVAEKCVDAFEIFVAMPECIALLLSKFAIWRGDREVEFVGHANQVLLPLAHLFAAPAGHAIVVDRERLVGDDQVLVDADDAAEAFAARAGAKRAVEREELFARLFERHAVGLEPVRKVVVGRRAVGRKDAKGASA